MTREKYSDKLDYEQRVDLKLNFRVQVYAYVSHRQTNVDGKWVLDDPVRKWYDINDISYFREQDEKDRYNLYFIDEHTVVPTEWCIMVYYDRYDKKQTIIPVVGNPKELNDGLEGLRGLYYKGMNRLDKMNISVNSMYFNEKDDDYDTER